MKRSSGKKSSLKKLHKKFENIETSPGLRGGVFMAEEVVPIDPVAEARAQDRAIALWQDIFNNDSQKVGGSIPKLPALVPQTGDKKVTSGKRRAYTSLGDFWNSNKASKLTSFPKPVVDKRPVSTDFTVARKYTLTDPLNEPEINNKLIFPPARPLPPLTNPEFLCTFANPDQNFFNPTDREVVTQLLDLCFKFEPRTPSTESVESSESSIPVPVVETKGKGKKPEATAKLPKPPTKTQPKPSISPKASIVPAKKESRVQSVIALKKHSKARKRESVSNSDSESDTRNKISELQHLKSDDEDEETQLRVSYRNFLRVSFEELTEVTDDGEVIVTYKKKPNMSESMESLLEAMGPEIEEAASEFEDIIFEQMEKCGLKRRQDVAELHLVGRGLQYLCDMGPYKNLRILYLNNNKLQRFGDTLFHSTGLCELYLHDNELSSLLGLKYLTVLRKLLLHNNQLQNLEKVVHALHHMSSLEVLTLFSNPCAQEPEYRKYVLFHLPAVQTLDRREILKEERAEGHATYNQDRKFIEDKIAFGRRKDTLPAEKLSKWTDGVTTYPTTFLPGNTTVNIQEGPTEPEIPGELTLDDKIAHRSKQRSAMMYRAVNWGAVPRLATQKAEDIQTVEMQMANAVFR